MPTGAAASSMYFPHQIEEHLTVLEASPLAVRAIREPRIPDRPGPVVAVFHAVKPGIRAWFQRSRSSIDSRRSPDRVE